MSQRLRLVKSSERSLSFGQSLRSFSLSRSKSTGHASAPNTPDVPNPTLVVSDVDENAIPAPPAPPSQQRVQKISLANFVPAVLVDRYGPSSAAALPTDAELWTAPVAVLFADITGFTALTELLASRGAEGAEAMKNHINAYFNEVIDSINDLSGDVQFFAGDAMLAFWTSDAPTRLDDGEPATNMDNLRQKVGIAAHCALQIQERVQAFDPGDLPPLRLRVGVSAGRVTLAHVGGHDARWVFLTVGQPLVDVGTAESLAQPSQVVLSPPAWDLVAPMCKGVPVGAAGFHLVTEIELAEQYDGLTGSWRIARTPRDPKILDCIRAYCNPSVLDAFQNQFMIGQNEYDWMGELRPVTVMFLKIDGWSDDAGDGSASPEPARIRRAHSAIALIQAAAARFQGNINKVILDDKGLLSLIAFGLPPFTSQESASRAISTAFAVTTSVSELGLGISVGITTGTAYCGAFGNRRRSEWAILGDCVNLSARLMQAANGSIICDSESQHRARVLHQFDTLDPIRVKGKADPIPVFRPIKPSEHGAAAAASPAAASPFSVSRTPMVGRGDVLARLHDKISTFATTSSPFKLLLVAAPGMGKSRLIQELVAATTTQPVTVLHGTGSHLEERSPFYPWRPVFETLLRSFIMSSSQMLSPQAMIENLLRTIGSDETRPRADTEHSVSEASRLGTPRTPRLDRGSSAKSMVELQRQASQETNEVIESARSRRSVSYGRQDWRPPNSQRGSVSGAPRGAAGGEQDLWTLAPLLNSVLPGLDLPENERTRAMIGQVRLDHSRHLYVTILLHYCRKHSLIFVLDDIQWFDSASWDLLQSALRNVGTACWILGSRPMSGFEPFQRIETGQYGVEVTKLQPLTADESARLVAATLKASSVSSYVVEFIAKKASGNPFFVEEVARSMQEGGLLSKSTRESISAKVQLNDVMLPGSVTDVVVNRINLLPTKAQLVLKVASVIGSQFSLRQLMDIFPEAGDDSSADAVQAQLDRLSAAGLLLKVVEPPNASRARLGPTFQFSHITIKEVAYTLLLSAQRKVLHTQLGHWYEGQYAEDPRPVIGALAYHFGHGANLGKSAEYSLLAGTMAYNTYAIQEAVAYLSRAMQIMEEEGSQVQLDQSKQVQIASLLGAALYEVGDLRRSQSCLERALQLAGQPLPTTRLGKLGALMSNVWRHWAFHRLGWYQPKEAKQLGGGGGGGGKRTRVVPIAPASTDDEEASEGTEVVVVRASPRAKLRASIMIHDDAGPSPSPAAGSEPPDSTYESLGSVMVRNALQMTAAQEKLLMRRALYQVYVTMIEIAFMEDDPLHMLLVVYRQINHLESMKPSLWLARYYSVVSVLILSAGLPQLGEFYVQRSRQLLVSLDISKEPSTETATCVTLGAYYMTRGEFRSADHWIGNGFAVLQRQRDVKAQQFLLGLRVCYQLLVADRHNGLQEALQYGMQQLEGGEREQLNLYRSWGLLNMAKVYAQLGELREAAKVLDKIDDLCQVYTLQSLNYIEILGLNAWVRLQLEYPSDLERMRAEAATLNKVKKCLRLMEASQPGLCTNHTVYSQLVQVCFALYDRAIESTGGQTGHLGASGDSAAAGGKGSGSVQPRLLSRVSSVSSVGSDGERSPRSPRSSAEGARYWYTAAARRQLVRRSLRQLTRYVARNPFAEGMLMRYQALWELSIKKRERKAEKMWLRSLGFLRFMPYEEAITMVLLGRYTDHRDYLDQGMATLTHKLGCGLPPILQE